MLRTVTPAISAVLIAAIAGLGESASAATFATNDAADSAIFAESFTQTVVVEPVAKDQIIDLAEFSPLPQYSVPVGHTLESVDLSLQGDIAATANVAAVPQSPLSALFSLQGAVRLLTPDQTVLFSYSGLETEHFTLTADALPFSPTLALSLPEQRPFSLPADDPVVQQYFLGDAALPLQLVVESAPALITATPLDVTLETALTAQLQVTYRTRVAPVVSPATPVPEANLVWGVLINALGLIALGRPWAKRWRQLQP